MTVLSFQIFFAAHFIACFWFYLTNPHVTGVGPDGTHAGRDDDASGLVSGIRTWTIEFGVSDATVQTQYIASLYWTFTTMLTVGYGDIHATNTGERLYSALTMIFGAIMFGAIIAKVQDLDHRPKRAYFAAFAKPCVLPPRATLLPHEWCRCAR